MRFKKCSCPIARTLNQMRRDIGVIDKDLTPTDYLENVIYPRNIKKYNDPLGPTFEWFINVERKSFQEIIESATRPGGKDLGF